MSMEERIPIRDQDVYAVTDKGDEELKRGSTEFSHSALELLVLLDGKSSFAEIAQRTKALSIEDIRQTAQLLAQGEYIKPATLEQELNIDFSYFFAGARRGRKRHGGVETERILREYRAQVGEEN